MNDDEDWVQGEVDRVDLPSLTMRAQLLRSVEQTLETVDAGTNRRMHQDQTQDENKAP
jgi:hypothetical protein